MVTKMSEPENHPIKWPGGAVKKHSEMYKHVPDHDPVNHPAHYTAYNGLEVIDLTEQMNFNRGNAVKYIARAGKKDLTLDAEIQDLEKARWYIDREIQRLKRDD